MTDDDPVVRGVRTVDDGAHRWTPDAEARATAIADRLASLLNPIGAGPDPLADLRDADRIAVVPDVHYPFHPSTGMVTDPAVVAALVDRLGRDGAAVSVIAPSTDLVDADRCGRYLGYPDLLADRDAEWTALDDEGRPRTVVLGDDHVTVSVPERLEDVAVVVVPTLRPTSEGSVAGAMRTLASVGAADATPDGRAAAAVTRAVDPVAILDATVAFGGEPYAANALFAGEPAAVDAVAASVLDRDPGEDAAIRTAADAGLSVRVGGVDLDALREAVPSGDLPPSSSPNPAVTAAYRCYATVTGDAVPPQLEGER